MENYYFCLLSLNNFLHFPYNLIGNIILIIVIIIVVCFVYEFYFLYNYCVSTEGKHVKAYLSQHKILYR